MRILVADDERIIRKGVSVVIKSSNKNWNVIGEAADGPDVFEFLEKEIPDVLITDIRMPQMDGIRLAKLVRQKYPDMLIIIISGYADFNFAKEAIKFNAIDYLLKPTNPYDLINALNKAENILHQREKAIRQDDAGQNTFHDSLLSSEDAKKYRRVIQEAIQYIGTNYRSHLTMAKVAGVSNMSPNYFCDLFKQETGVNFSEYLTRIRICKAKELLKGDCNLKINEVSEMVGYNGPKHFCQVFKKLEGITPTEFKELKK